MTSANWSGSDGRLHLLICDRALDVKVGTIHRLAADAVGPTLDAAVGEFLAELVNHNTARSYATPLRALVVEFGADTAVAALDREASATRIGVWFARRWGTASPATINARLDALRSAAGWWRDQGWIAGDPFRRIRRQARTPDRTRAVGRDEIEALLTRPKVALRERTLWRLLYETAARTDEVLSLDADDLDLRNRRATVRRKGAAADIIVWRTPDRPPTAARTRAGQEPAPGRRSGLARRRGSADSFAAIHWRHQC